MRRSTVILSSLVVLTMLSACGMLQSIASSETAAPTEQSQALQSPMPQSEGVTPSPEGDSTLQPSPRETLPPPTPTEPPPMQVWPLAADLFYLTDSGQIWRQPMLGDDTLAGAVTRPDLSVQDFAVAPGGDWLIYRADEHVGVISLDGRQGQIVAQGVSLPVETAYRKTVAWSPDATKLAYITADGFQVLIPGAGQSFEPLIYAVPEQLLTSLSWSADSQWLLAWRADGSSALYNTAPLVKWVDLGRINDYTWLADGRLAFAPQEGGLALLTPGDVQSRVFIVPQDRQVTLPVQRPDGLLAFFGHSGNVSEPGFLYVADPADLSFGVESSVAVYTAGLVWDPEGMRLVGRDPQLPSAAIVLDPLTGARGSFQTAGPVLAFDWGDLPPHGVMGLNLPANLYYLSPQAGITQVWRLPAGGDPPEAITTTPTDVVAFDISGDGVQVVYTSAGVIYTALAGSFEATQVVALSDPTKTGSPAFSPDGQQIAYADGGIWVYDRATGQPRRLVADRLPRAGNERLIQVYDQPRWSSDGAWLLVRVTFYEGYDYALIRADGTQTAPLMLNMFNSRAEWADELEAFLYYAGGTHGAPFLNRVQPGDPPTIARLVDLPVIDVAQRDDGRLALLRVPLPGTGGPTSVQVYSLKPNGTDLRAETGSFVMEQAVLSPGAGFIAGLIQTRTDEAGVTTGRLALVDTKSEQVFVIESASGVRELRWGQ